MWNCQLEFSRGRHIRPPSGLQVQRAQSAPANPRGRGPVARSAQLGIQGVVPGSELLEALLVAVGGLLTVLVDSLDGGVGEGGASDELGTARSDSGRAVECWARDGAEEGAGCH